MKNIDKQTPLRFCNFVFDLFIDYTLLYEYSNRQLRKGIIYVSILYVWEIWCVSCNQMDIIYPSKLGIIFPRKLQGVIVLSLKMHIIYNTTKSDNQL